MSNINKSLYNAMLGLAIGDALGVPAEFLSRSVLDKEPVTDMQSGGMWNQPAGTWSDDTAMALATLQAIKKNGMEVTGQTLIDIMDNFVDWYLYDEFAANKYRFDIGNTCEEAILNYHSGHNTRDCGCQDPNSCGNGALMRIVPAMLFEEKDVMDISRLTHNNITCDLCSLIYIKFLNLLLNNSKEEAFGGLQNYMSKYMLDSLKRLQSSNFTELTRDKINSSGYVIHTLEAAIWCFMNTESYEECVLKAVNLGKDTDTTAAVAGGLAGLYYGINEDYGIPERWISKLRDKETFDSICKL